LSALGAGYVFARCTVTSTRFHNEWYNRPDLKPFPAMVHHDYQKEDVTADSLKTNAYLRYKHERDAENR